MAAAPATSMAPAVTVVSDPGEGAWVAVWAADTGATSSGEVALTPMNRVIDAEFAPALAPVQVNGPVSEPSRRR